MIISEEAPSLDTLPQKLILAIVESLIHDKKTLLSLSLVNRQLRESVLSILTPTLPPELVYMIISLIDDLDTLFRCSVTSHLLRKAALPKLWCNGFLWPTTENEQGGWPRPLLESHELSHIKRLYFLGPCSEFPPLTSGWFDGGHNLRYFSTLNLQELRMDGLQLSGFMPNIKQYFGHLAPTLQSLTLFKPKASCKQILYFIGLFKTLRNLKLIRFREEFENETSEDETLEDNATAAVTPRPLLDGWLTLGSCEGEKFVVEMINLYGKLRFRCVNLYDVQSTQHILYQCMDTLETLQLEPCLDCYGENFF